MRKILNHFTNAIKFQYADFSGRAGRREFWSYAACYAVIHFVIAELGIHFSTGLETMQVSSIIVVGIMSLLSLALVCPTLAITIRRLHDTDRSAWWMLVCLIPALGAITLLVLLAFHGFQGNNKYGSPVEE